MSSALTLAPARALWRRLFAPPAAPVPAPPAPPSLPARVRGDLPAAAAFRYGDGNGVHPVVPVRPGPEITAVTGRVSAETDIGPGQVNVVFRLDTYGETPQGFGAGLEYRTDAHGAEAFRRGQRFAVYFVPEELDVVPQWMPRSGAGTGASR